MSFTSYAQVASRPCVTVTVSLDDQSFRLWIHYTLRTKDQAVLLCDVGGSVGWWEWAEGAEVQQEACLGEGRGEGGHKVVQSTSLKK